MYTNGRNRLSEVALDELSHRLNQEGEFIGNRQMSEAPKLFVSITSTVHRELKDALEKLKQAAEEYKQRARRGRFMSEAEAIDYCTRSQDK